MDPVVIPLPLKEKTMSSITVPFLHGGHRGCPRIKYFPANQTVKIAIPGKKDRGSVTWSADQYAAFLKRQLGWYTRADGDDIKLVGGDGQNIQSLRLTNAEFAHLVVNARPLDSLAG